MNYDAAKFWFEVIVFCFNVALWLYVWRSNKDKATVDRIERLEEKHSRELTQLRQTIAAMDSRLVQAIGHADLAPIYNRLKDIGESFAEMSGEFRAVKHQLTLIQEHLMNKGGKA